MVKTRTAYLLWCLSLFALPGLHRFYLGKPVSGVLYLCTFGFFGIGQIVDLFLIPGMVEDRNLKHKLLYGTTNDLTGPHVAPAASPLPRLDVQILTLCRNQGGATISDCVIETGTDPAEVKAAIQQLCLEDLLFVDNRAQDGAVIYKTI